MLLINKDDDKSRLLGYQACSRGEPAKGRAQEADTRWRMALPVSSRRGLGFDTRTTTLREAIGQGPRDWTAAPARGHI